MSPAVALAGIIKQIEIVKNNVGNAYIPAYGINGMGNMEVGEGYMVYATQDSVTLIYPSYDTVAKLKQHLSGAAAMLKLPAPKHYRIAMNTGNNATYIGKQVSMEGRLVPDSCEIGAFNGRGNLVGAGSVIRGRCAFAVWGNDPQSKGMNGCATGETISLKLWDGRQEYPLDFIAEKNMPSRYVVNGILTGSFVVPGGYFIKGYDLSRVYPNPFRDNVKIEFDIPEISGSSAQNIEINVFDFKGTLVRTIAKGTYAAGHYVVSWNVLTGREGGSASEIYFIQMKTRNFEKRVKIIRIK
jgi:hypothetical protein